jgi:hypothetical protein
MLVYSKQPMGYTSVGDKRVYGKSFAYGRFGPTEITYKEYMKNRDYLVQHPVTSAWLSSKFDKAFPEAEFTYENMHDDVSFETLVEIANLLEIKYVKKGKPTIAEKRSLRRAIIFTIDQG